LCGTPNLADGRIVNGVEATPNEFPWIVALFMDAGYFCTGALISDQWVLTAAHCQDGVSYTDVYLGSHNVRDATQDPHRIVVRASQRVNEYVHPNWAPILIRNDIALIKLPAPVNITGDYIRPICMPTADESDHAGDKALISGWGKISDATSSISPTLQKGYVTVMSNDDCRQTWPSVGVTQICSPQAPTGTCNGDSGSSMGYQGADGRYTSIGITSFGSSAGCESGAPDVFTRTSSYLDWISQTTGIQF